MYSKNQPRMFDVRKRILDNIPWDLRTFELDINRWNWVSMCHNANLVKWVIEIVGAFIVAQEYSCTNLDNQLFHVNPIIVQIPLLKVKLVCVFMQVKKSHTLISPGTEDPSSKEDMFWFLEYGFIIDIEWDPNEWFWKRLGTKFLIPFYQYTSRTEYWSIIRHEGQSQSSSLSSTRKD